MIIHFKKNPKNGGSPPKDKKFIKKQNFNRYEKLLNIKIWLILNKLNILKIIVIDRLTIVYNRK